MADRSREKKSGRKSPKRKVFVVDSGSTLTGYATNGDFVRPSSWGSGQYKGRQHAHRDAKRDVDDHLIAECWQAGFDNCTKNRNSHLVRSGAFQGGEFTSDQLLTRCFLYGVCSEEKKVTESSHALMAKCLSKSITEHRR